MQTHLSPMFYEQLVSQLAQHSPTLVVSIIGLILSLTWWARMPRQCLLVMLASVVALVHVVGWTLCFSYLIESANYTAIKSLGIFSSIINPLPHILLLMAAFSKRSTELAGFPVQMQAPPPPPFPYRS